MANIEIAVWNASTVLSDAEIEPAVQAFQVQVTRDFAPAWAADANLTFVPRGSAPKPGSWWLAILDNSDQATALGYHDLTNEGLPLGKAFAGSDIALGYKWTVTATHELLEMLGDPDINLSVFIQKDNTSGVLYAREVCDACEADKYGYDINGVTVSDFVYPAWFETFWAQAATQFDYQKAIQKPVPELLPGGYIGYFDVSSGSGWQQLSPPGAAITYDMRARVGSRRERRRTPRNQWLRSQLPAAEMPAGAR